MRLLSERIREVGIISIILIIILSNGLLFYFQNITERDLKSSLFEEQKKRQFESTKEISEHIEYLTKQLTTLDQYCIPRKFHY